MLCIVHISTILEDSLQNAYNATLDFPDTKKRYAAYGTALQGLDSSHIYTYKEDLQPEETALHGLESIQLGLLCYCAASSKARTTQQCITQIRSTGKNQTAHTTTL